MTHASLSMRLPLGQAHRQNLKKRIVSPIRKSALLVRFVLLDHRQDDRKHQHHDAEDHQRAGDRAEEHGAEVSLRHEVRTGEVLLAHAAEHQAEHQRGAVEVASTNHDAHDARDNHDLHVRDGQLVGEYAIENLPRVELVSKMLGKELDDLSEIKSGDEEQKISSDVVYDAEGLSSIAARSPFNFSIHKGEVNGFTGLLGSGRSECVRAIFGADKVTGGTEHVNGKGVHISKPRDAMKHGIGYLPEDRKRDGIVGDLSVRDNIILALQVLEGFFGPISRAKAEKFADEYIKLLDIKTASTDTPIKSLSGGNQQKVILARWLLTNPQYLILDEPTRGIDIGTKIEIQKLVLKLAGEGKSVTFISSEIDEMLRTCSRLIVMRDGKQVGELSGGDLTQTKVMSTIAGGAK